MSKQHAMKTHNGHEGKPTCILYTGTRCRRIPDSHILAEFSPVGKGLMHLKQNWVDPGLNLNIGQTEKSLPMAEG